MTEEKLYLGRKAKRRFNLLVTDIISIIAGIISIILALYAIWYAKRESALSAKNYEKTKEMLIEIEKRSELIDQGIRFEQDYLFKIINKILDIKGQEQIEVQPTSLEEINEIMERKTADANKRLKELESVIEKSPTIHVGKEAPSNPEEVDIWIV